MLYFSQAKQDPDKIDLDQLKLLREFKQKTFPKARIENYSNQIEFRDKLWNHLEIQIRTLLAQENQSAGEAVGGTDLLFEFSDPLTGSRLGQKLSLHSNLLELPDIEELPDYEDENPLQPAEYNYFDRPNQNYYRQAAAFAIRQNFYRPVRFWLKNAGGIGARDVFAEVIVTSDDIDMSIGEFDPHEQPRPKGMLYGLSAKHLLSFERSGNIWTTQLDLGAIQPKREISPASTLMIGARKEGAVIITARIYADTLPEPVTRTLQIDWKISATRSSARKVLEKMNIQMPTRVSKRGT